MKILVTGAKGFVGKNLCWALKNIRDGKDKRIPSLSPCSSSKDVDDYNPIEEVFEYDLDSTPEELDKWCRECDFVFNLAGVNRPQNQEEFMQGNFGFASTLLDTLKKYNNRCPVMLSSSQQASLTGRFGNSEYGRSKKAGEELFLRYQDETGAKVLVYTEVESFIMEGDTVLGVRTVDQRTGEKAEYRAAVTVNAAGIWGHHIASLAGVNIGMFPAKGALLIFAHRVNSIVINRCRKPANADILVPGDTVCVIGTTSTRVPYEECDHMHVTPEEVDLLLTEGAKLAPVLENTRILRAYAGVRPLVSADNDPSGRNISRGIVCLDHEVRDGVKGFVSITGGKLMTYRLMAEQAADAVCKKLHVNQVCKTAVTPLPGSATGSVEEVSRKLWSVPVTVQKAAAGRSGDWAEKIAMDHPMDRSLVCECEEVSVGEAEMAIRDLDVHNLTDLRRRTRVGMGTCQAELCACRAAGLLVKAHGCADRARADLKDFMNERWKGMYPVAWGETLREGEFTQWIYKAVLGL